MGNRHFLLVMSFAEIAAHMALNYYLLTYLLHRAESFWRN